MTRDEARQLAAQAWCHPKTSHKVMDTDLCEAFADILVNFGLNGGSPELSPEDDLEMRRAMHKFNLQMNHV
jgi:hypothetical protein